MNHPPIMGVGIPPEAAGATLAGFLATRVVLVAVRHPRQDPWTIEEEFDELAAWVAASGRSVIYRVCQRRPAPDPATYIGRGKAEQLRELCDLGGVDGVIVAGRLTPSQRDRLEGVLGRAIRDRGRWIPVEEGRRLGCTLARDRRMRPRIAAARQAARGASGI
jgi:hypothetical protein